MAKLRGSTDSKLMAINEALMLAVVSAKDHAELINMIISISKSINKQSPQTKNKNNVNYTERD